MPSLLRMWREGEKLGVLVIKAWRGGQRLERMLESPAKAQNLQSCTWKDVNCLFTFSASPSMRWMVGSTVGDMADACCHPQSHRQLPAEPAPEKEATLQTLRLNTKRNEKGNVEISHFPEKCKLAAALNLKRLEQGSRKERRSSRRRAGPKRATRNRGFVAPQTQLPPQLDAAAPEGVAPLCSPPARPMGG